MWIHETVIHKLRTLNRKLLFWDNFFTFKYEFFKKLRIQVYIRNCFEIASLNLLWWVSWSFCCWDCWVIIEGKLSYILNAHCSSYKSTKWKYRWIFVHVERRKRLWDMTSEAETVKVWFMIWKLNLLYLDTSSIKPNYKHFQPMWHKCLFL